jgi:hypothetical protein
VKLGDRVLYRRQSVADWIQRHEQQPNPRRKG